MIRPGTTTRPFPGILTPILTLRHLKQIHALLLTRNLLRHRPTLHALLHHCSITLAPHSLPHALLLLTHTPSPDLPMFNTAIRGFSHSPSPATALRLFHLLLLSPLRPDHRTFPFLLRACTKLRRPLTASQLHAYIVRAGLTSDTFIRNALINLHSNCGDLISANQLFTGPALTDAVAWSAMIAGHANRGHLPTARHLFDHSPYKDAVSYNVMITAYTRHRQMALARELFDQTPSKDVVSWNAMIAGYVKCGGYRRAMEVFEEMKRAGERADEVTMVSLLAGCADSGELEVGERLLAMVDRRGMSVMLGNAAVDMYAKCGGIGRAVEVFRGMRERDVTTWNTIIGGMALHGRGGEAVGLFEEMCRGGVRPNEVTFLGVLMACSHGGMVAEGRRYFSLMQDVYGIEANVKHCGCMVDMLGRAGMLEEAFGFIDGMKVEPNAIVWRALLGACQLHGNVELGERANRELLKLRHDASGDYVLLSNIYASKGVWSGVEKVREMMDDRGVIKEAGCALF